MWQVVERGVASSGEGSGRWLKGTEMAHLAAIMGIHGVSSSEWLPSNQS